MKQREKVCIYCGSTDIVVDAYARWSPEQDMFVLDEVFEYTYCNQCDGETTAEDKEKEDELLGD